MGNMDKDLALPCGCIIGLHDCDEAKRIFATQKARPRGRHNQQGYSDAQLQYFEHISKGVRENENAKEAV